MHFLFVCVVGKVWCVCVFVHFCMYVGVCLCAEDLFQGLIIQGGLN